MALNWSHFEIAGHKFIHMSIIHCSPVYKRHFDMCRRFFPAKYTQWVNRFTHSQIAVFSELIYLLLYAHIKLFFLKVNADNPSKPLWRLTFNQKSYPVERTTICAIPKHIWRDVFPLYTYGAHWHHRNEVIYVTLFPGVEKEHKY